MALIASENYATKRIYLGIDSVGVDVLPIDIYIEHRERRRLNASGQRKFRPMISAFGNEQIGPAKFTPRFTNLAAGVRIIPYDTTHSLLIRGALISTADSLEGRDLFDRATLVASVDIDYQPPQVEIITVVTGDGGFTAGDRANLQSTRDRVLAMNKALGREPGVSATVMDAAEGGPGYLVTSDGAVDQVLTLNNDGSVTIENAPD